MSYPVKAVVKIVKSGYVLKNIKRFSGMEGGGFSVSLYKDGRKLGTVNDNADGGPYYFDIKKEDMSALDEFSNSMSYVSTFSKETMPMNSEMVVYLLIRIFEIRKKCKTKVVYVLKDQDEDSYMEMKYAYSPQLKIWLEKKYGENLALIYNEIV